MRSGARGLADAHLRLLWALTEKARDRAAAPPWGPALPCPAQTGTCAGRSFFTEAKRKLLGL